MQPPGRQRQPQVSLSESSAATACRSIWSHLSVQGLLFRRLADVASVTQVKFDRLYRWRQGVEMAASGMKGPVNLWGADCRPLLLSWAARVADPLWTLQCWRRRRISAVMYAVLRKARLLPWRLRRRAELRVGRVLRRWGLPGITVPRVSVPQHPSGPALFTRCMRREAARIVDSFAERAVRQWLRDELRVGRARMPRWEHEVNAPRVCAAFRAARLAHMPVAQLQRLTRGGRVLSGRARQKAAGRSSRP